MDNEILSQNLKMLRKNHKLTQVEVAELIGKERSLIAKYESGKAVPPLNILQSFAKLYNVSVDDLCGEYKPSGDSIILESGEKSRISYSDLSDVEKAIILKLRLSDENTINEIYESLGSKKE